MTFATAPEPDWEDCDVQCARCGSSLLDDSCPWCCGNGWVAEDEDGDLDARCDVCQGTGTVYYCLSSVRWCAEHPQLGRELVAGGTPEWFRRG